jgi:NAD(P)-dependent dehydrogenase (short-subunit alcohol dehydrogenase family)
MSGNSEQHAPHTRLKRASGVSPGDAGLMSAPLDGIIAVVTGASRGAGRGIAAVLGENGATVYVTGRSVRGGPSAPDRAGSIEETAEEVIRRGGTAVAVRCDHTIDAEIAELFERVRRERGRLDLLVNNAWGGYEQRGDSASTFFGTPFWEQPLWRWQAMFDAGVRATFVTSRLAAPLLMAGRHERPGLIVNTIAWAFGAYLGNVLYDTAKAATARLAFGFAHDLRPHLVGAVAIAPGHLGVNETPEYLGRAVTTLAADHDVMRWSGQVLTVDELAREYGFTDIDGTQPEPFAIQSPAEG